MIDKRQQPNRTEKRRQMRTMRLGQRADMKLAAAFEGYKVNPRRYRAMIYEGLRTGLLTDKQAEALGANLRIGVEAGQTAKQGRPERRKKSRGVTRR